MDKYYNEAHRQGWEAGYQSGYKEAFDFLLLNTKELINELGEEQGLKALRDWLKHELKNIGGEE